MFLALVLINCRVDLKVIITEAEASKKDASVGLRAMDAPSSLGDSTG